MVHPDFFPHTDDEALITGLMSQLGRIPHTLADLFVGFPEFDFHDDHHLDFPHREAPEQNDSLYWFI